MKKHRILFFLYGGLPAQSFLSQQLKINSIFDLVLKGTSLPGDLALCFPLRFSEVQYIQIQDSFNEANYQAAIKTLPENHGVIFWPAHQIPIDTNEFQKQVQMAFEHRSGFLDLGKYRATIYSNQPHSLDQLQSKLGHVECLDFSSTAEEFSPIRVSSSSRSFNQIIVRQGLLTKISINKEKGQQEAFFLQNVPQELQKFYPRVVGTYDGENGFSYSIEEFKMLDLGRHLIHHSLGPPEWKLVFSRISKFLKATPAKRVDRKKYQEALEELFVKKLKKRIDEYHRLFRRDDIYDMANELIYSLQKAIHQDKRGELRFIHGDLCLSNILLDRETFDIKLIDPRGCTSLDEAMKPIIYEFAKLSQCVFGGYDWIMAQNLRSEKKVTQDQMLQRLFRDLMKEHDVSERFIRLAEASLFLSMLPLHMDQPHLHGSMIQAATAAISQSQEFKDAG